MAGKLLLESELPDAEVMRSLAPSALQLTLLKDLRSTSARAGQKSVVKDLLDMIPSPSQHRIFKAVHDEFSRRFARGSIAIGEMNWNLAGDPLKVYRTYTAVRETLAAIAAPRVRLRNTHAFALKLPVPAPWVQIIWDQEQPAIRFVPDPVLDGLCQALTGLDPRRIKRCPECGTFFLAWRLDKSACSPRCLNLARVHRHRAKRGRYEYNRKLKSAGL